MLPATWCWLFALLVLCSCSTSAHAKTVKHQWALSPLYNAPDGHYRMSYVVNGTSPGPVLVGDEGDDFEVTIMNQLPVEMTVHWHGIFQRDSPEMDGTPGVSQWGIPPNANYTYKFAAPGQMGLHWYHAHVRGYLDDGVVGLIYIRPDADRAHPFHLISSDVSDVAAMRKAERHPRYMPFYDWRHVQEDEALSMFDSSGRPTACVDTVLFNGKGRVFCPNADFLATEMDQRYKIEPSFVQSVDVRGCLIIPGAPAFDPVAISSPLGCQNTTVDLDVVQTQGKWTVLNVANVGGEWTWIFSIDAHDMWIVSADGEYIRPKKVQALPVSIGQRYMVVIPTDKAQGGDYFIRANCQGFAQVIAGVALLRYGTVDDDDGDSSSSSSMSVSDQQQTTFNGDMLGDPWLDLSQAAVRYNSTLINGAYQFDPLVDAAPYPAQTMPAKPDVTMIFHANQTETTTFQIGSKAMADVHDLDMPVLYSRPGHSAQGDPSWLYRIPDGAVVDVIIQNAPNALFSGPAEPPHPIHLHGHKYWVLGSQEYFTWTYESVDAAVKDGKVSLNLDNPSSRDTFLLPTAGWFVFRFIADNPGAWLMHCHISAHLHSGMGIVFLEGADHMPKLPHSFSTPPTTTPADAARRSLRMRGSNPLGVVS